MGRRKKQEIPFWAKLGHQKPTTRREFLATGLIPFFAWGVGPSLATLLGPGKAFGQTNCANAGTTYIPFITLNLAGGPSLASQVVAKTLAGANLSSYTRLGQGLGPGISYNVATEFQGVEFAGTGRTGNVQGNVSKFLTGVRDPRNTNTRITALDKTAFIWQAVASADDTAMNPFDITGLVIKMGLQGSKLPNLGRSDTKTGINQQSADVPPPAPFVVGNVNDLTNALGYAAAFSPDPSQSRPGLSTSQKAALAKVISRFSSSQIRRLASTPASEAVTKIVECAGIRNIELVTSGGGDVNPLSMGNATATRLAQIWQANANQPTSQNSVFASMVYNGLVGNASTINLNLGGYDYHDNTRTTGDNRDLAAGQIIGKILETADFLQKPVFVYVCADGATVSAPSVNPDSAWTSDRGIAGMQFILAYHPTARPNTSGFHIGGFNNGQAADGSFPTGSNPNLAAQAVFANYAAWNNRMDFLEQFRIAGDNNLRNQVIKLNRS